MICRQLGRTGMQVSACPHPAVYDRPQVFGTLDGLVRARTCMRSGKRELT
jgi:hypothetical protein